MTADDTLEATPDELLLELMDLVTLAFPEPLCAMTITFVEAEERKRPALTNLDGRSAPLPPGARVLRPDLGHGDNAVLDAINSLLIDFSEATRKQGGVRVLTGRLEIEDGPDGDRFVELVDTAGDEPLVRMKRRFDRSELRWLFWTAPLFRALHDTEETEREQRAHLEAELRRFRSFQIDMVRGEIAFSGDERPASLVQRASSSPSSSSSSSPSSSSGPDGARAVYGFELLGSWSDEDKRLLWGFANDQVPERLKARVESVRAASTGEGLRALTEPSFGCPEPCAERLARHVAARTGALGVYRAPFKSQQAKGFMYLALTERITS